MWCVCHMRIGADRLGCTRGASYRIHPAHGCPSGRARCLSGVSLDWWLILVAHSSVQSRDLGYERGSDLSLVDVSVLNRLISMAQAPRPTIVRTIARRTINTIGTAHSLSGGPQRCGARSPGAGGRGGVTVLGCEVCFFGNFFFGQGVAPRSPHKDGGGVVR
jgi:hypothetical protein